MWGIQEAQINTTTDAVWAREQVKGFFSLKSCQKMFFQSVRDGDREFQTVGLKTERSLSKGHKREARNCQQRS